jgi:hypothetical protein
MKVAIFWDIAPCDPYMNRRLGGNYNLQFLESRYLLAHWFLARMIFDPEDGGDTFLRNVGSYTDCTTLYLKRWQLSSTK